MWRGIAQLAVLAVLLLTQIVNADIGFLLHESTGNPWYPQKKIDTGFLTQGGHGAILVSNLCAESPTKLRKCINGEQPGVVISRYDGLSKEEFDWVAVPYSWYLYGVPTLDQEPLFATQKIYQKLAERFYDEYLSQSIARVEEGKLPPGRWIDTVAATFRRDIYSLNIRYDENLEEKIVAPLNDNPNTSRFDFFVRNCSDFAADFFDQHFKNFNRTNLGDIGFTSPKGVALSVAQLGRTQGPGGYETVHYTQVPGNLERSRANLYAIENTTRNPKWALLMLHFQPYLQAGFAVWNLIFHFDAEKEHQDHFSYQASLLNFIRAKQSEDYDRISAEIAAAKSKNDLAGYLANLEEHSNLYERIAMVKTALKNERTEFFGSDDEWEQLKNKITELKQQFKVPAKLFDLLEKKGEFGWIGKSLMVTWDSHQTVIAGEKTGSGDQTLLRWIRISRLDYFVNTAKKNRPPIAAAREELKKISEL